MFKLKIFDKKPDIIKSTGLLSYSVFGGDVNVLCPHGAALKEDLEKEEKLKN
jgi:hypothetical protein